MLNFNVLRPIKGAAQRALFFAKDKSPELFFIGGVVSMAAAGYFTWNGKAKCEKILDEYQENMKKVKEMEEAVKSGKVDPSEYGPKDAKRDRLYYGMKAAVGFARVIGLIVVLAGGSVLCFGRSTGTYKKRYLEGAAVIASQNQYIKQLEGQIGEEKLEEMKPKSPSEETDGETLSFSGPFQFWFDETSHNFVPDDPEANRFFLWNAQQHLNDILELRTKNGKNGAVTGNEQLEYLDIHTGNDENAPVGTQAGAIMGNSKSKNPRDKAAGYIDFGIWGINQNIDFGKPILLTMNWDATPVLSRSGMAKR